MTIQKPTITELRYVNGEPDPNQRPDQQRIQWTKNGEPITGASGDTTSDGVLNRAPVQIHENTLTTHTNTKQQQTVIEELVDAVNALTGDDDADLGSRIADAEADIDILQLKTNTLETKVGSDEDLSVPDNPQPATGLFARIKANANDIGVRNPMDVENPIAKNDSVRDDLFFIKQRVGNERGYDWNGNPVQDKSPTGLYLNVEELFTRVNQVGSELGDDNVVGSVKGRLTDLEESSSVGDVADIREEIGLRNDRDPTRSIYVRMDDIESGVENNTLDVNQLQLEVQDPTTGLIAKTLVLEQTSSANATNITDLSTDVNDIVLDIGAYSDAYAGTIKNRLSEHATEIADVWSRIGYDDIAAGTLGYRVKEVEQDIGDPISPVGGTVWYSINTLNGVVPLIQSDVNTLLTVVGQNDTEVGTLRYNMIALEDKVGNDVSDGSGFTLSDAASIAWTLNGIQQNVITASHTSTSVELGVSGYDLELLGSANALTYNGLDVLTEAPLTGDVYGRRNGAWEVITGGGGSGADPTLGFTLLGTSSIRFDNANLSTRDVLKNDNDVTVVGDIDYTIRFDGEVDSITMGNAKSIKGVKSDTTSYDIIAVDGTDKVQIGQTGTSLPVKVNAPTSTGFIVEYDDDPSVEHVVVTDSNIDTYLPVDAESGFTMALGAGVAGNNTGGAIDLIKATDNGAIVGSASADTLINGSTVKLNANTEVILTGPNHASIVVETTDDVGNKKPVIHTGNVAEYAPSLAPSDGMRYVQKDGTWEAIGIREMVTYINTVDDFEVVTPTTIELQNGVTYIISGAVDIGPRKFIQDSTVRSMTCGMNGSNPYLDKIVSSTEDPLFDADDMSIKIDNIAVDTHGLVFDLRNTHQLAFCDMNNFNIDNAIGMGQVLGYNRFSWTGESFISYLWGDATECRLTFGDAPILDELGDPIGGNNEADIVVVNRIYPHCWLGPLFDFANAAKYVQFAGDLKISHSSQQLLANTVDDTSIDVNGIGFITHTHARLHHEVGSVHPPYDLLTHTPDFGAPAQDYLDDMDATSFAAAVKDGYFLGGVNGTSVDWQLDSLINLPVSQHFARMETDTDQTLALTAVNQNLLSLLSGISVQTSRYTYDGGNFWLIDDSFVVEPRSILAQMTVYYSGALADVDVEIEVVLRHPDATTNSVARTYKLRQNNTTSIHLATELNAVRGTEIEIFIKHKEVADFSITVDNFQAVVS